MAKSEKRKSPLLSMPQLKLLLSYQKQWLRGDLLAGVTVAAYLIPQCMAYGELAGVQSVVGLWAILPPMIIYTILGSSRQLSVGPESTTAVMTAVAVAPLVAADGSNYASLASLLALIMGIVCIIGYFARLGFLANLLSKPILIGYMAGVALIMIGGQLGKISGISIEANLVFEQIFEFLSKINQIHQPTFILAIAILIFLFAIQKRFPYAPGPLLVVLIATAVVALFNLDSQGIAVVGTIPAGLPKIALPNLEVNKFLTLVASAIGIAVVGYSDNVLTARAFANRNSYKIDANQELLALGVCNFANGLMQGFPVSSSGSRTAIGNSLGNKTQLFSLVALVVVVLVLFFLHPLLTLFPKAALGVIVIYAATKLIEVDEFVRLYQFRRSEFALAIITSVAVLATDILIGVGVAIGLSIIELFARISQPHDAVLGKVEGLDGLHDIDDWTNTETISGLVIYRYDAPLFFANVENFKQRALKAIEAEKTPVEWFMLNAEAIAEVDITALDMLTELYSELAARQIRFTMTRVKQDLYAQLVKSHFIDKIGAEYIYFTLETGVEAFKAYKNDHITS